MTLLPTLVAIAVATVPPPAPVAPAMPISVAGRVVDARSGQPVPGARVQQDGAVTSAFTRPDGSFRLPLERGAGDRLTVTGVGYEDRTAPVGDGRDVVVRLTPIAGYAFAAPALPAPAAGTSAAEAAPLNTGLILAYRLRAQETRAGTASFQGLVTNDYRLAVRLRLRPWLLDAEGSHHQTDVDVTGLELSANPAFRPSTWQAGARVGLLTPLGTPDLELAAQVGYRWTNTVPNNADVPYTGSSLDWEQTRHALGPVGTIAWRPGRGRFHLEGGLGWYGVVLARADEPGRPFADRQLLDARAVAGYEIVPGLRVGLSYQVDRWTGEGGADLAHVGALQLHYTPGGTPEGKEP